MKIIDAFTFYNELDLLDLRLKTLDSAVDFFVIVEMSVTFSGVYKGFLLESRLDTLPVSRDRVKYVKVDDYPNVDAREEDQRWTLEYFQRNAISRGIEELDLQDYDIVIVSDLDEIPDPESIPVMVGALRTHSIAIFCQSHRKYFLNSLAKAYPAYPYWLGSVAASVANLRQSTAQEIRRGGIPQPRAGFIWTTGQTTGAAYIDRGGWHLTYFNGPKMVRVKLESISDGVYAHAPSGFVVPVRSRHNWRDGRSQEIERWRDALDVDVLPVGMNASEVMKYVPKPVAEDPMTWEWVWWLDTPLDAKPAVPDSFEVQFKSTTTPILGSNAHSPEPDSGPRLSDPSLSQLEKSTHPDGDTEICNDSDHSLSTDRAEMMTASISPKSDIIMGSARVALVDAILANSKPGVAVRDSGLWHELIP